MTTTRRTNRFARLLLLAFFFTAVFELQQAQGRSSDSPPPLPSPGKVVNVSTEPQLQAALQRLNDNTTIVLAKGTYRLTRTLYLNGAFNNVGIRGASNNRDDVVIQGPGLSNTAYGDAPFGIWTGGKVNGITIANLTIRDFYYNAIIFNDQTMKPWLHNLHLIDSGQFVKSNANRSGDGTDNGIVEYSVLEYTRTTRDAVTNGVAVFGGSNWIISHNLFRNLVAPSGQLAGPAVFVWGQYAQNTVTEGNTFLNCARGIAYGAQDSVQPDHRYGIIRNNFFYRSPAQPGDVGIILSNSPGTQVLNNTVIASGTYGTPIEYQFYGTTGVFVANNLLDGTVWGHDGARGTETSNYTSATPSMFVSAATGDLHLNGTAIGVIDRGVAVSNVKDDFDGQVRPLGLAFDIGADEFGGTAATYQISGTATNAGGVAMAGVTLTLGGTRVDSTATNGGGSYAFNDLPGGTYTVTPSKFGYVFTPPSLSYAPLNANRMADFTANLLPPTIAVTSPSHGDVFPVSSPVVVSADATSAGSIVKVDFYASATLIGTATKEPYSVTWSNAAPGTYQLTAIATDQEGGSTAASVLGVTINAAPTVSIVAPTSGKTYTAPATIAVTANAADVNGSVAKVDFYAGSTLIGTSTSAPYGVAWNNVPVGSYTLTAVAADDLGATGTSAPVTVTVSTPANTPPTISLTAPASGSEFASPATIALTASATDADGSVTKVDFYSGTTLVGTATGAPYSVTWRNVGPGSYSLTAVATDNAGATATSRGVTVTVTGGSASTAPPAPWLTVDVGTVTPAGSATVSGGTYSLRGSGADIWGTGDAFRYVYQPIVGDGQIVARVVSLQNTNAWAKAGVMVREDLTAGSRYAALVVSPSNGFAFQRRTQAGWATTYTGAAGTAPTWMKLVRSSSSVSVYTSSDGATWRLIGADTVLFDATISLGLAVTSHANGLLATATFDNVTVTADASNTTPPTVLPAELTTAPLVQPTSLAYQGAFRLPLPDWGTSTFAYGGTALAFNPARNSLFLVGHDWVQQVGEVSVPEVRTGASVDGLDTATLLQPLSDVTEGRLPLVDPGPWNTIKIGGLLPYQGQLFVSAYSYYDGDVNQAVSHFVSGLDLSVLGDVRGPYRVGSLGPGFMSGYFGLVPPAWQAALGGPVLNGNCCLAVVGRTSFGPAASTIDPATIGQDTTASTSLVYYPSVYPSLGAWNSSNPYFNGTTEVKGVVFPEGTRSVLFFGRHGLGAFCYGTGLDCNDPVDGSKGTHGYPYAYYVWAYDAVDLAAVKNHQKQPWEVRPYAVWQMNLPFAIGNAHLNGAAYDPATGRIFLSQAYGDGTKPLIHVFTIQMN